MNGNIELYNKYFLDSEFERLHLFEVLRDKYGVKSAIYPGSFVHITPAFVFSRTAFIDNDRRVEAFFKDTAIEELVNKRRQYKEKPDIFASQQNYDKKLPIEKESFDLLISQYAGFVSQAGKPYLKKGGLLIANNSHADGAMAHLDNDYELIGVANHKKDRWTISIDNLDKYFEPKKGVHPNKEEVQQSMKSIGYTKSACNYIFIRVN